MALRCSVSVAEDKALATKRTEALGIGRSVIRGGGQNEDWEVPSSQGRRPRWAQMMMGKIIINVYCEKKLCTTGTTTTRGNTKLLLHITFTHKRSSGQAPEG
jgi:hypothetical protein